MNGIFQGLPEPSVTPQAAGEHSCIQRDKHQEEEEEAGNAILKSQNLAWGGNGIAVAFQ